MKLKEAALIRSGLVLSRKQAKNEISVRYPLITLRSISPKGYINRDSLEIYAAAQPLNDEYLTHPDDIVIRLSFPYTAVLIDETTSDMVISSNFVVIRTDKQKILPEYLVWLLNTEEVRRRTYDNTTSNMLGAIKSKYYAEFEIEPISIDNQRKIARLHALAQKEIQLLLELADEKEKYYARAIQLAQSKMTRSNNYDDKK